VKRRELAIVKEYEKAAKDNDQKYFNTENGPITQRLSQISPIFPSPFGRFGKTGDKVHALVAVMAKARVSKQNIAWGRGEDTEKLDLSIETAYIRPRPRMSQVGNGGLSAADRRQEWSRTLCRTLCGG